MVQKTATSLHEKTLCQWAIFSLGCACVRTHTGREMSAHKKTWSAHKCFLHIISYTSFKIKMSSGKML